MRPPITHNTERRRATLRLILGNAQMFMAVVTLVLLWRMGVCPASLTAASVTGALVLTSVILFRVVWRR